MINRNQIGGLKGIIIGALIALCIVGLGAYLNPFGNASSLSAVEKLNIAILLCSVPATFLAVAIGRLAKHRFFSSDDIGGAGLSNDSGRTVLLQSLLQNTVEQTLLASLVYFLWSVVMPAAMLSVVPIAAIAFGVGRLLFFIGYRHGAATRAIGFSLSFYPSIMMLIVVMATHLWRQFG